MKVPTYADAFEVLCLQAADSGRGDVLFGECFARARKAGRPFMVGKRFPSVYLEFPLAGEPFLDITMLYGDLEPGTRLVLYTDGVTEAEQADKKQFGEDRLLEWAASLSPDASAKAAVIDLYARVKRFTDGADQNDDITLLSVLWNPATKPIQE